MSDWLSAHFCFGSSVYTDGCDRVIRDVVAPLVARGRSEGWAQRAFFIRYSENGPHVRLRMLPSRPEHRDRLERLIDGRWMEYRTDAPAQMDRESRVSWIAYQPELDRYGGADAISLAEQLFDASTELALATVTPDVSLDRSARLGRALLATLIGLHGMVESREAVVEFAASYARSYLTSQLPDAAQREALVRSFDTALDAAIEPMREYVDYAWQQLESGESLTTPLDRYRDALERYRDGIQLLVRDQRVRAFGRPLPTWAIAGRYLGSSMIHMTNNRLGVSIAEESYIALAVHRVLSA